MTEEEKQLIAIEIDKYFRMRTIDACWFSSHINVETTMPDDGFEPQSMSKFKIDQDGIDPIQDDIYGFSGNATVLFEDKTSKIGCHAKVQLGGQAITVTASDRTWVKDIVLTSFHRTTDIIPKE